MVLSQDSWPWPVLRPKDLSWPWRPGLESLEGRTCTLINLHCHYKRLSLISSSGSSMARLQQICSLGKHFHVGKTFACCENISVLGKTLQVGENIIGWGNICRLGNTCMLGKIFACWENIWKIFACWENIYVLNKTFAGWGNNKC